MLLQIIPKPVVAEFHKPIRSLLSRIGDGNIVFLILLLFIVTVWPLALIGITTRDDADISINFDWFTNLYESSRYHAAEQGRFSFFWTYPLLRIPYLIDSQVWYFSIRTIGMLALLVALYFAIRKFLNSSSVALLATVLFLAFVQNGWDHNALTAYPFSFNILAASFLSSLLFFSLAIDRNKISLAVFSGLLYFVSLGIELFALFSPFYVVIFILQKSDGVPLRAWLWRQYKYLLAIFIPFFLYLAIYVLWRISHPSNYDGASINSFDLLSAAKVIVSYSFSAFPYASLKFLASPELQSHYTDSVGLGELIKNATASTFLKTAVVGYIVYKFLMTENLFIIKPRLMFVGAALSLVGMFLPNVLLGFIQKHQDWVSSGSYSYLYTYYSFVSLIVFLAFCFAYINSIIRLYGFARRLAFVSIMVILTMIVTVSVDIRNSYIAFDQKLSYRKWQLMNEVVRSSAFMAIPNGSVMVAPSLISHYRGIAIMKNSYWTAYTRKKIGKDIDFINGTCASERPCFYLAFRQARHKDEQFVVLARVIQSDQILTASDLSVFVLPRRTGAVLAGAYMPTNDRAKVYIDGVMANNVGGNIFSGPLANNKTVGTIQVSQINGNVKIFPDQIIISDFETFPRLQSYSVELGSGFYGWESAPGQQSWAWSERNSTLALSNFTDVPAEVVLNLEVTSLENISLRLGGRAGEMFSVSPGKYREISFPINLPPGVTLINFEADRPAIHPDSSDTRLLSFSVRNIWVKLAEGR